MGMLADHDVPCDPGGNGILITASGEAFAKNGYAFPPADPNDVFLVDGWAITYDRILTTFDHVTLSRGPDKSPTDQSQCDDGKGGSILCGTGSSVIAEVDGPFAVDLHKGGPLADADGADLDAAPVAALTFQNKAGNAAFDATTKYAFGFEIVKATKSAHNVNLDAADLTDYQEMVTKGYTTFLIGTATWKGNNNGSDTNSGCTATTVQPAYDFAPAAQDHQVPVRTDRADDLPQCPEPGAHRHRVPERGAPARHPDQHQHLQHRPGHVPHRSRFWESFVHDSPAHFDTFASRYAGMTAPTATMEDFKGYVFKPFVEPAGHTRCRSGRVSLALPTRRRVTGR